MKFLSLLTVAIVLIGITTQAFACNYERMSRIPNYAKITTPKKILNVPQAHGICVAPNGNFCCRVVEQCWQDLHVLQQTHTSLQSLYYSKHTLVYSHYTTANTH